MLRHFSPDPSRRRPAPGGARRDDNASVPSFCNNELREFVVKQPHERSVINAPFAASDNLLRPRDERASKFVAGLSCDTSSDEPGGRANTCSGAGAHADALAFTGAAGEAPLTPTARALHRALASEARIRAGLRRDTKIDLQFTVRGRRGAGRTRETILDRVRFWRRQHTASIERTRALLASLGGVA